MHITSYTFFTVLLNIYFEINFQIYRYKSSQKSTDWSGVKKPIYLSKLGNNFAEWSSSWAGYLITKVRDPSLEFIN